MSTIISVISLFIAAISAMFTGLNLYSNRAVLIKFGEDDNHPLPVVENEIYAYSGKQTVSFNNGIMFHFQILNPSPKDIAYFNMHFVSDGRIAQVWTMKSFGYMEKEPKIIMTDPIKRRDRLLFFIQTKKPAVKLTIQIIINARGKVEPRVSANPTGT